MYKTSNDLSSATRRSVSELLNEHLANAIDLHLQANPTVDDDAPNVRAILCEVEGGRCRAYFRG